MPSSPRRVRAYRDGPYHHLPVPRSWQNGPEMYAPEIERRNPGLAVVGFGRDHDGQEWCTAIRRELMPEFAAEVMRSAREFEERERAASLAAAAADRTTFGAVARALQQNDYNPLPLRVGEKTPARNNWQEPLALDDLIIHQYRACGTGILTAGAPAVDCDVRDPAAVADLRVLVREMLGETPLTRVGAPPKFAALYRAEKPFFPKIVGRQLFLPSDDSSAEGYSPHRVEVLARGQHLASFAIHPGTGRPYDWAPQSPLEVPRAGLPLITYEAARAFVDAAEALMIEHHGAIPVRQSRQAWAVDLRPRGEPLPRNPANWWWVHGVPFDHLVTLLGLATEGTHVLDGKTKRWSQRTLAMRCPNHRGDHGNSLNFTQAWTGTILFHCYAGCDPEDVASAISEILEGQVQASLASALEGVT